MVKVAQKANCQLGTEGSSSSGFLEPAAPEETVWMPGAHPDSQANRRQVPAAVPPTACSRRQTTCSSRKLSHPIPVPIPSSIPFRNAPPASPALCSALPGLPPPCTPAPDLPRPPAPQAQRWHLYSPYPGAPAHRRASARLCVH